MRVFRGIAALVAIFGLVLQYGALVVTSPDPLPWMTFKFVGFFTILTNTLIALAFALPLLKPGTVFERPAVRMAIATYAIVMVVIYAVILAPLEAPQESARISSPTRCCIGSRPRYTCSTGWSHAVRASFAGATPASS